MEFFRQTMDGEVLAQVVDLPASLRGRKVEVVVSPAREAPLLQTGEAYGCLRQYANPALAGQESQAWQQAVLGKHATRRR